MTNIGMWNGHEFLVSPTLIRSFTGLQITGSSETEDKTASKQKYVKRKNGKPTEIKMIIHLNTAIGTDPKEEALALVEEARTGKVDYFYIGDQKLLTCKMMLVDAQVTETMISSTGKWINAEVKLTFKQASKNSTEKATTTKKSSSGSSGGSSKTSVKKTSTKTTKSTSTKTLVTGVAKQVADKAKSSNTSTAKATLAKTTVKAAKAIKKITSAANKSTTKKKTTKATGSTTRYSKTK